VFVCTMSDTGKSAGKEAMHDPEERVIWKIVPNEEGGLGNETLQEIVLPPSCKTETDLLQELGLSETVCVYDFRPHLQMLAIADFPPGVRARMPFNFYALKITGKPISGPLTVVCICDEQIINMPTFMKLCRENGMQLREFKFGTEKQFPGVEGDMLHYLLKTRRKYEASIKHEEEREASPASGSGAAASGSAAAEGDVRRSDRTRKPKQIFDPSEDPSHVKRVKREPQGD
jgi:hypothetical protein